MFQQYLTSLLERNSNIAATSWHPMPTIKDLEAMAAAGKGQGLTVLITCADPRADPTNYLGLNPGEMVVIRHSGGRITEDVLTTIEMLMTFELNMGGIIVVHHTDCGCSHHTDDGVRAILSKKSPGRASEIGRRSWGTFQDIGLDKSIIDDVSTIKTWIEEWKFVPKETPVVGYAFDVKTGLLREIVAAESK